MDAGFKKVLVAKLAKLNGSQDSINDLSQWCISHNRHRREVVETWESEFRIASSEKKVYFLYLANDVMQTSKEKSSGYISGFMRIIPAALNEVFNNGDDYGRRIVKRLIHIWEDRKIFDGQEQSVKDDFLRELKDLKNKLEKTRKLFEKIISSYQDMLDAEDDEDRFFLKCQTSLGIIDNLNKEFEDKCSSGSRYGSRFIKDLKEQNNIIQNSIENLKKAELLRETLISDLKEALYEQEVKVAEVKGQLQAAQPRYEKVYELCGKVVIDEESQQLKRSKVSPPPPPPEHPPSPTPPPPDYLASPSPPQPLVYRAPCPPPTFPPYTPIGNLPMSNTYPDIFGAPTSPPAFQGLQGMFYGPPRYPTIPSLHRPTGNRSSPHGLPFIYKSDCDDVSPDV